MTAPLAAYDPSQAWQAHLCTSLLSASETLEVPARAAVHTKGKETVPQLLVHLRCSVARRDAEAMTCFLCYFLFPPTVSGQHRLCQISQFPREAANQAVHTSRLRETASQAAEGIFQCSLASWPPFFNQLLSRGRKRRWAFCLAVCSHTSRGMVQKRCPCFWRARASGVGTAPQHYDKYFTSVFLSIAGARPSLSNSMAI